AANRRTVRDRRSRRVPALGPGRLHHRHTPRRRRRSHLVCGRRIHRYRNPIHHQRSALMTEPVEAPPSQSRLEQLGYSQQLVRRLNIPEVVGLAMADVSPTMAVLFLSAGVFVIGGTFSIGAGLILSVVVVLISLCLGELAGMFPIAGGMYSLVRRVLPGPLSWITMFNYLIQGVVIPASIALGMVA